MGNYRPVSLLPLPGKLLEKIVHLNIASHLEGHNILSDRQGGFRKNRSTISSIATLTDDLVRAMNEAGVTLATFIDLRKAFDTVNHVVLIKKLEYYGILGNLLEWCQSYITGRKQRTVANKTVSNSQDVVCGVPQGSVLGPLFFLLYINDLTDHVDNIKVSLYADDTVLYTSGDDINNCVQIMQNSLDKFAVWCKLNALTINTGKTKTMVFGTSKRVKAVGKFWLKVEGVELQQVPSYKYLGMTLDSSLNYKLHLANVVRTVSYKLYLLSRVRRYLTESSALLIYKTMIVPYMDYADVIYQQANAEDLDKIQRLQNRALKLCLRVAPRRETEIIHRTAKVPLLVNRRRSHVCNFMYKRMELGVNLDSPKIKTRSADAPRFILPTPNLHCYKRSVEYAGAKLWNNLSKDLKLIPNYLSFKHQVHIKLMETVNQI